MKKISILMALILIFSFLPISNAQSEHFTYESEIEVMFAGDLESGMSFYKKNDERPYPVASMSKLMSYLVVKDYIKEGKLKMTDQVEIDSEVAFYNTYEYSNFGTQKGEKIKVEDLLKALMVVSGNDATVALAKKVAKTEKNFVDMMNRKAGELGLKNSSFVNSSGITEYITGENGKKIPKYNQMSARDLFVLSRHILKTYPETVDYGKIKVLKYPERGYTGHATHPTLEHDKSSEGLKTGFTEEAGYGFVGLFDMNKIKSGQGYKIITIVNGAETVEQRAKTTDELVDFVKNNYKYEMIINSDLAVIDKKDITFKEGFIKLYPEKSIYKVIGMYDDVEISYKIKEGMNTPHEDGEALGELFVKIGDKEIETINLVNRGYVERANFFTIFGQKLKEFFDNIMMLF